MELQFNTFPLPVREGIVLCGVIIALVVIEIFMMLKVIKLVDSTRRKHR